MAVCLSAGMPMPVSATVKCSIASRRRRDSGAHLQAHLALLGELDGVAHQVDHDLPQPAVVADDQVRARRDG